MDHMSNLPDEVLCHILSFLPTKLVILTSVLSKRWRNLLAFVPTLDIDYCAFLPLERSKRYSRRFTNMKRFIGFMNRVLALQGDNSIKKFHLKCRTSVHENHLNCWIRDVLHRGVSDLELFINDMDGYHLPQEMFVSRTLVNLKLCKIRWWPGAQGIFLPKLKTLTLTEGWSCSDKLEMVLPAFPVLEELYIKYIILKASGDTVLSSSLKKLTFTSTRCEGWPNIPTSISMSFDTPSLLYLNYSHHVVDDYPIVNFTNLVEAVLNLWVSDFRIMLPRCTNVWKLMSGIRDVQKLTFSSDAVKLFSLCCESMPVFNNLKMLRIMGCDSWRMQAVPVILKNCPHLETLLLESLPSRHYFSWEGIGRWLISSPVKKIHVERFKGRNEEMGMIKHLLESFQCLKEIKIDAAFKGPDIFKYVVEMVNLYNASYQVVVFTSWCVIHTERK